MTWLPDVVMLGRFPLAMSAATGLVGGVVAYALAGWLARRSGPPAEAGAPQELILDAAVGGVVGAKLVYVLLDLPGYLANPLALLLFPYGPLALPAGLAGAAAAAAWGLRRRPDKLSVLDGAAAPLLAGAALAATGWKGPGTWAFAPFLGLAAAAALADRLRTASSGGSNRSDPGIHAAHSLTLAACALVLADLASPAPPRGAGLPGRASFLQVAAAVTGTVAWLWTRRRAKTPGT